MSIKVSTNNSKVALDPYITIGCIGLIFIIFFEIFYLRKKIFLEAIPSSDVSSVLCSIGLFISTFLIFWGLTNINKSQFSFLNNLNLNIENSFLLGTILLAVTFLGLFISSPNTFSDLAKEDNFVEWTSAIFLFVSSLIILACLAQCHYSLYVPKVTKLTLIFFAVIFFLIAMEEISWFQRVIDFKTPELLLTVNQQKEFNLHNFATNKVENAYYIGSFIFLVFLPFLRYSFLFVTKNNYLNLFVPQPSVIIPAAIASAYNYDMWDNPFIQIIFFASLVILCLFSLFCNNRIEKVIAVFTLFLIAATQAFFLLNGSNFERNWDVTEYKELFIPLGFSLYCLSVFNKTKQIYLSK